MIRMKNMQVENFRKRKLHFTIFLAFCMIPFIFNSIPTVNASDYDVEATISNSGTISVGGHNYYNVTLNSGEGLYFEWSIQNGYNITIYFESEIVANSSFGSYTHHSVAGGSYNITLFNNASTSLSYILFINIIEFTEYIEHSSLTIDRNGYPLNIPGVYYIILLFWFISLIACLLSPKLKSKFVVIGIIMTMTCFYLVYFHGNLLDENNEAYIDVFGGGDGGVVINAEIDFTPSDPLTMEVDVEIYNSTDALIFSGIIKVSSYYVNTESAYGFVRLPKGQYKVVVSSSDRFRLDVREWGILSEIGPSSMIWQVPLRWFLVAINIFVLAEAIIVTFNKIKNKDNSKNKMDTGLDTENSIINGNLPLNETIQINNSTEMSGAMKDYLNMDVDTKIAAIAIFNGVNKDDVKCCIHCTNVNPKNAQICEKCGKELIY